MSKQMIFRISVNLQEKIAKEYAQLIAENTGIEVNKILRELHFGSHGFTLNVNRIGCTTQQKEILKQLNNKGSKSRLFNNRDFSLGKPEKAKRFRFDAQRLDQMKQAKKDKGFQR